MGNNQLSGGGTKEALNNSVCPEPFGVAQESLVEGKEKINQWVRQAQPERFGVNQCLPKVIRGTTKSRLNIYMDIVLLLVVAGGVIFLIFNWSNGVVIH